MCLSPGAETVLGRHFRFAEGQHGLHQSFAALLTCKELLGELGQPGSRRSPRASAAGAAIAPGLVNHRMVGVGRDLCGSSIPTLLPKQGHLQ